MKQTNSSPSGGTTGMNFVGVTYRQQTPGRVPKSPDPEADFNIELKLILRGFGKRKHALDLAIRCVKAVMGKQMTLVLAYWRPAPAVIINPSGEEWELIDLAKAKARHS